MKGSENYSKRVVIKIGGSLFCSSGTQEKKDFFSALVTQITNAVLIENKEIIIVSSGAIALGSRALQLKVRPKELSLLQAAAAIGQNLLIHNYAVSFREESLKIASKPLLCAQLLLTWDDFNNRKRYLNAKNTINSLLRLGAVPVINENDTIATEEICFGDNDRLSALVATMVNADLLIILSDVDGLLDKDSRLVRVVAEITPEIRRLALPTNKDACVGGMITKIEAAKIAVDSGIPCIIANGRSEGIINLLLKNYTAQGTLFKPQKRLTERERWLAFGAKTKGKVVVDKGATAALLKGMSLLSVGVVDVKGEFEAKDVVSIVDEQHKEFARGKINVSSRLLKGIKRQRYDREIIHCDNIVLLNEERKDENRC